MQYLLYTLTIPFLYVNYKIVISDLKNKIIPNKYLAYLLLLIPFYYIYIFNTFTDINYLLFIGQIVLTFVISFVLYSFGIWAAGDAKYLLVLSLFIPYIGIIPFIGNIALLTILYLLLYFIWFYFGKCVFYKGYTKSLLNNIKIDLNEKWIVYKGNKGGKTFFIVLKWLVVFLIIFVSIRLSRIYLFNSVLEKGNNIELLQNIIEKYHFYLVFGLIGIFIGLIYVFKLFINKFKKYIGSKMKLDLNFIGNIFVSILFILLISFISYELINNYKEISYLLVRVFSFYLAIYIIIKIFIYSYKITFGINEMVYIDIKDLKESDIINITKFNKKILPPLGYNKNLLKYYKIKNNNNIVLSKEKLKNIYKIVRIINKKDKKFFLGKSIIKSFECLKTFPFGIYIFIGFIITYFLNNLFINIIIENFIFFLKNFTN